MDFKLARQKLESAAVSPGWKEQLESEYAQFVDTVKQWQQLQMERVQQSKQKLAERIETETSSLTSRYRELENSLKMQHKRLALLTAQVM
jgi:stearoyl-CoA desaturase (delta-9 desaturase)